MEKQTRSPSPFQVQKKFRQDSVMGGGGQRLASRGPILSTTACRWEEAVKRPPLRASGQAHQNSGSTARQVYYVAR